MNVSSHNRVRCGAVTLPAVILTLVGLFAAFAPPVTAQAMAVRTGTDARVATDVALATFDSAWNRIRVAHYDASFAGVDWDAVRVELRPRAASAQTMGDLRSVITDMLSRIGESHYTLIPQEVADAVDAEHEAGAGGRGVPGDLGLELRLAEGRLVVWRVDPAGPAARAGVRPGWIVDAIDARRPEQALSRIEHLEAGAPRRNAATQFLWGANAQLEGPAGSHADVRFLDAGGRVVALDLERRPRPGDPVRFGNLPTFFAHLDHRRIETRGGCMGIIRFNVWMVPLVARFDQAIDALRDCRGMVIDLRGNPGGIAGMVMGVSGHFLDDRITLGTMRSRGTELNFVSNPRRVSAGGEPVTPFAGPVAILVDGLSVSTSEFFAGGMQAIGRARIFGETTAGQALPATLMRLPNGDVLMYVVADFQAPGGLRLEGRGVLPDEPTPLRRADLLAGRDAALDAALAWLRERGPEQGPPARDLARTRTHARVQRTVH